ncbi:hypothetical protein DJ013_02645 [Arcticibacterium luteifluviistationis]|uniref:Uncharacterized protein n=1 Tax=Arcticibacterium luteifluviistationis TaxID=1784714 RepID=A0A2Z4G7Q2_9BACT|nr:hypothetical protein DJ013_02645 [Arcticibacterium luteifluviistationis]
MQYIMLKLNPGWHNTAPHIEAVRFLIWKNSPTDLAKLLSTNPRKNNSTPTFLLRKTKGTIAEMSITKPIKL